MEEYKMLVNRSGRQVILTLDKGIMIGVKSGSQQGVFDGIAGPNWLFKLDPWLIERAQGTIGIRMAEDSINGNDSDDGKLEILFRGKQGEDTAEITLIFAEKSNSVRKQRKITERVRSIVLVGNSLKLLSPNDPDEENNTDSTTDTHSENGNATAAAQVTVSGFTNSAAQATTEITAASAEESFALRKKEFLDRIRKLEEENQKLYAENEALRANRTLTDQLAVETADLAQIVRETENIDAQLKSIRRELPQKRNTLSNKEEELRKAIEEKAEAEKNITEFEERQKEAEEEIKRLKTELDKMQVRDEVSRLDIQQVSEEIRVIRERLSDDNLTLLTMEDDALIGTGSVKGSLMNAEAELEKAERKIGLITRLRETYNDLVQEVVVRKNSTGFLTADSEAGGK